MNGNRVCFAVALLPCLVACGSTQPAAASGEAEAAYYAYGYGYAGEGYAYAGGEEAAAPEGAAAPEASAGADEAPALEGAAGQPTVREEDGTVYVELPAEGPSTVLLVFGRGAAALAAPAPEAALPPVPAAPTVAALPEAEIVCGGDEHIRLHNRRIGAAGAGIAVLATGRCVVEITEANVIGEPAIVARDQATVRIVESNVRGDIVTDPTAQIEAHGSTHVGGWRTAGELALAQ